MTTTMKPIHDLTAEDLMSRDLVAIPRQTSLRDAAHLLADAKVTGAPVTDEAGRCVGALSATDLVRWMDRGDQAAKRCFSETRCFCCDWEVLELEALPVDAVSRHMTEGPVTAKLTTPIGELSRWMLDAHIHRVFVVDERGRPVGVVSTTDVVAAVARQETRDFVAPDAAWLPPMKG